jgi:4-hydroxy-tetrahydrodipicolinate synthase
MTFNPIEDWRKFAMNADQRLPGALTALITPFTQSGSIDWDQLGMNIEFQLENGMTGLVPMGTTGESPTIGWKDHHRVIVNTVRQSHGRAFVLAGTGSNNTKEAIAGSVAAIEDGAGGVLLVECYYNKPASSQLRAFYHSPVARAVAQVDQSAVVIPYIIPGRTSCQLQVADLALLAQAHPNVCGVKEATGDLKNMTHTRLLCGSDFQIYSGDDGLTAQMMMDRKIKGNGVISVVSNICPKAVADMVKAFQAGDHTTGQALAQKMAPLFKVVGVQTATNRQVRKLRLPVTDKFPNPCAVKTMMAGLGIDSGVLLPPLGRMNLRAVSMVREALTTVWTQSPELLEPLASFYKVDVAARLKDDQIWNSLRYDDA